MNSKKADISSPICLSIIYPLPFSVTIFVITYTLSPSKCKRLGMQLIHHRQQLTEIGRSGTSAPHQLQALLNLPHRAIVVCRHSAIVETGAAQLRIRRLHPIGDRRVRRHTVDSHLHRPIQRRGGQPLVGLRRWFNRYYLDLDPHPPVHRARRLQRGADGQRAGRE